jgi:hypothetical protein
MAVASFDFRFYLALRSDIATVLGGHRQKNVRRNLIFEV